MIFILVPKQYMEEEQVKQEVQTYTNYLQQKYLILIQLPLLDVYR